MTINKEKMCEQEVENYIKELGCSVVEKEIKISSNLRPDIVGYTIDEKGDLIPRVVAEVITSATPQAQMQLFSYAKKLNTDYALLALVNEEKQYYWFDAKTSLPVAEPKFQTHFRYYVKEDNIIEALHKCFDILRNLREFDAVYTVLILMFIRSYLYESNKHDELERMDPKKFGDYLKEANIYYNVEINMDDLILSSLKNMLPQMTYYINYLKPVSGIYPNIFIGILEKMSTSELGASVTTKNLNSIINKILKNMNIKKMKFVDLAAGFGFANLNLCQDNNDAECLGIELNNKVAHMATMLSIISGYKNIKILNQDALTFEKSNYYDVVFSEPPVGLGTILKDYEMFTVNAKRSKVDYSELFIEKSISLVKKSGFIITIVPDGILFSQQSKPVRKLILEKTIVRGIISLPQHIKKPISGVKLSILILQKKQKDETAENFFTGKIESLEDIDIVISSFTKWMNGVI